MAVTPYELRSYPGAAADTSLAGGITASALTFAVAAGTGTGFPDGTGGPFFIVLDYDTTSAEKVHCTARTGDTFTVNTRGADGTSALSHGDGAKIRACWTATDAQEANRAAHATLGQVAAKGDLLTGSGSGALAKTAVGANNRVLVADSSKAGGVDWKAALAGLTLTGATIDAASSVGGVTGTQIAADHAALTTALTDLATAVANLTDLDAPWTAWNPLVHASTTDPTITNRSSAYKLIGKTLHLRCAFTVTAVGSGIYTVVLPASMAAAAPHFGYAQYTTFAAGGAPIYWNVNGAIVTFGNPTTSAGIQGSSVQANAHFDFTATIEVA